MSEAEYDNAQEAAEEKLPDRPGRRLREAREARNLSREQVGAELRLHQRLVTALEEDDDASLPPPAFVAGYLRNYARLLGLPANEVVGAYERHVGGRPEIVSRVKRDQVSSRSLPVRLVTWVILLGLAGLLVAWWLSQQPLQLPGSETEDAPTGLMAPEDGFGGTPPREAPSTPALGEQPQEPAAPEALPPGPMAETPEPVEVPEPAEVPQPAETPEPPALAEAEPTPEPEAQGEPEAATPAGADDSGSLRLQFDADSWTEVIDANGRRLLHGLVKGGRNLTLEGEPPFKVSLGYAPGVTVYYRGERFDHQPYTQRNVARFQIGGEG